MNWMKKTILEYLRLLNGINRPASDDELDLIAVKLAEDIKKSLLTRCDFEKGGK